MCLPCPRTWNAAAFGQQGQCRGLGEAPSEAPMTVSVLA